MPWTKADVDKHKKGLSDTQKDQWVRIANSALAACIKKGGTDATCAPSAIRQANGVVGHSEYSEAVYSVHRQRQPDVHYEVTHQTHQGKEYLVVPVVMMVEGVHNGSHGPLLHTIEELGRFPASWNGIPIVIDHPEVDGQNISANEPDVIDARLVGRVYHTRVDGARLMAQAWLEEEKLRQLSAIILAQIEAGEPIEVSLGMFTEELTSQGDWNGEQYEAIARNHRPDHLALLPGGLGACSIEDGCGIRANKKGGKNDMLNDDWVKTITDLKEDHYTHLINANIDQGYKALVDAARQKLDSMDSENSIHLLQEVYDEFLVYEVRLRVGGTKLYKQGYTFESGAVTLQGSPTEVRRKVEYVAMAEGSGMVRTKFNTNKKSVSKMADNVENCTPCVQKKVTELIGDGKSKFTEADRPWLETLSEEQLGKLVPTVIEKEVTKEVNVLLAEDKAILDEAKALKKQRRDANIKIIQDNVKDLTAEDLNAMSDSALSKFAGMLKEEATDYSVRGGIPPQFNASAEEPLPPTGVTFK